MSKIFENEIIDRIEKEPKSEACVGCKRFDDCHKDEKEVGDSKVRTTDFSEIDKGCGGVVKFIDQIKTGVDDKDLEYRAGQVRKNDNGDWLLSNFQYGAERTFSIGQPVYDNVGGLLGYLGIGVFKFLDYSGSEKVRVPVEYWRICLPTERCKEGVNAYTYWQLQREGQENR